jgi:hypothetical protein
MPSSPGSAASTTPLVCTPRSATSPPTMSITAAGPGSGALAPPAYAAPARSGSSRIEPASHDHRTKHRPHPPARASAGRERACARGSPARTDASGTGHGVRLDKPTWRRRWERSTSKDLASHGGPESCVCVREGVGEALTGVRAGSAIEPRNQRVRGADVVPCGGRQHRRSRWMIASGRRTSCGRRTDACTSVSRCENREIPRLPVVAADVLPGMGWVDRRSAGREGKAKARSPR